MLYIQYIYIYIYTHTQHIGIENIHWMTGLVVLVWTPHKAVLLRTPKPSSLWPVQVKSSQVKVTLRPTVSQSVCLAVEPNLGLLTRDFSFFLFFFFQSYCLAVSAVYSPFSGASTTQTCHLTNQGQHNMDLPMGEECWGHARCIKTSLFSGQHDPNLQPIQSAQSICEPAKYKKRTFGRTGHPPVRKPTSSLQTEW
jgi:hypothetical protein